MELGDLEIDVEQLQKTSERFRLHLGDQLATHLQEKLDEVLPDHLGVRIRVQIESVYVREAAN